MFCFQIRNRLTANTAWTAQCVPSATSASATSTTCACTWRRTRGGGTRVARARTCHGRATRCASTSRIATPGPICREATCDVSSAYELLNFQITVKKRAQRQCSSDILSSECHCGCRHIGSLQKRDLFVPSHNVIKFIYINARDKTNSMPEKKCKLTIQQNHANIISAACFW